jgi:signal transduction histidine kinase
VTEVRHYKKNGDLRWARVYGHPIWDPKQNRLGGIVGAVQDITEQKLTEEQNARQRNMLEKVIHLGKQVSEVSDLWTTLDRIWHGIHDDLGFDRIAIFLYNAEHNSMDSTLGTDREGNQVKTWGLSFPIEEDSRFKTILEKPEGVYFTHDYQTENYVPPNHKMHGVKDFTAVAAWAGDKPVAAISADNLVTGRPITAEQLEALRLYAGYVGLAIENALLNESLQKELDQKKTFINELESKNAELERFTYTVSHDLKSPLVTITGFLGFLEHDAISGDIEKVRASAQRISGAAKKMEQLLSDLLELSRIGRLMNPPEDVPFEEIVAEALERVRGRIEASHIQVIMPPKLPVVHGDRIRLVEAIQNLLDNAAKFTGGKPDARVEVRCIGLDEHDMNILVVCDNGIGIAPQYHERIFGLFNKLNPNMEGTGIGLTLVKRIVEVHGGRIWVESQANQGTSFYFTLPSKSPDNM